MLVLDVEREAVAEAPHRAEDAAVLAVEHGPSEEKAVEHDDGRRAQRREEGREEGLGARALLGAEDDDDADSRELQLQQQQLEGLGARVGRVGGHHVEESDQVVVAPHVVPEERAHRPAGGRLAQPLGRHAHPQAAPIEREGAQGKPEAVEADEGAIRARSESNQRGGHPKVTREQGARRFPVGEQRASRRRAERR